ncbi:MAG: hypothetical protein D4S01_03175 [Dehalococcoidia bacterium]|nr:MAG: hypothetical protein D4S01_03175 [Dehalococcoidia bacterium]
MKSAAYMLGVKAAEAPRVPAVQPAVPAPVSKPVSKYTPDQLYDAIRVPEMGNEKNPWIRTKVRTAPGGSTAYGPVQLTNTLASDYAKRYPKIFTPQDMQYINSFQAQAQKFKQHGNMKGKLPTYNPAYDYGGAGDLGSTPENQTRYGDVARKMMAHMYAQKGYDLQKFIQAWRGQGPTQDPEYYSKVYSQLGR